MKVIDDNGNKVNSYILFTFEGSQMTLNTQNADLFNKCLAKEQLQAHITKIFMEAKQKEGNKSEHN